MQTRHTWSRYFSFPSRSIFRVLRTARAGKWPRTSGDSRLNRRDGEIPNGVNRAAFSNNWSRVWLMAVNTCRNHWLPLGLSRYRWSLCTLIFRGSQESARARVQLHSSRGLGPGLILPVFTIEQKRPDARSMLRYVRINRYLCRRFIKHLSNWEE